MGFKCFYVNRDTSLATVDVRFDDCFQRNSTEPHPDKLENAYFGVGKFALEPGRENLLEKKGYATKDDEGTRYDDCNDDVVAHFVLLGISCYEYAILNDSASEKRIIVGYGGGSG